MGRFERRVEKLNCCVLSRVPLLPLTFQLVRNFGEMLALNYGVHSTYVSFCNAVVQTFESLRRCTSHMLVDAHTSFQDTKNVTQIATYRSNHSCTS